MAVWAPAAAQAAGPQTVVRHVSPVTDTGVLKPGYRVTHRWHGAHCQMGSFMTGSAYRCTAPASAAAVLDPCWLTTDATVAVCQPKPWQHRVIQLTVKDFADGGHFRKAPRPWGLAVASHLHCLLDPGSVRSIQGHPLRYHCNRKRDIFGGLRHGSGRWRAHVYRKAPGSRTGYKSLGWHGVSVAWRGLPSQQTAG